jgi:large subunit ribosomal protein L30
MKKYKIVQVKSGIGRPERQKRTLIALGLRKLNNPKIVEGSPQVEGMINAVKHLLHVEEVSE